MAKIEFLGTGWDFPPTFEKGGRSVVMISDEDDINSSLEILLSTNLGERIMHPNYGCNLKRFLFEPIDAALKAYIKDLIKTAVLLHEPRIRLEDISLEEKPEEAVLEITLTYIIIMTNSRYNFVYPFYLTEGTNIRR